MEATNESKINDLKIKQMLAEAVRDLNEEQQVFTKSEAAAFLKVSVGTIERLAFKKNEIAYSKPGKSAVFLRRDLLKFLMKRRIPSVWDEGI
jgi:excisionase family DNA binding protein